MMQLLFRLPFLLLEALLRRGAHGLETLRALLGHGGHEAEETWTAPSAPPRPAPAPEPARAPAGPPPPTADEVLARRAQREAESPPPPRPAPEHGPGPDHTHIEQELELVESTGPAEDVHGAITVDVPWEGYDHQPASEIVSRVRGADSATKAVVRLYERGHKNRATVIRATG